MKTVSIIADSTCDLSKELLEKYHITTFPRHIHLGDREYLDGVNITPDEIYKWSDERKETPKTSTVSPGEAREVLESKLAEAREVLCFCISENMSSCANVMQMTANDMGVESRVFIINSENLSTGIGLQVIDAAIMAEKGMSAVQIVQKITDMQPRVRASFVVDTLTYLYRGGRCSGLAAMAGSTLKLHPYISVINGKMQPGKKYRGKLEKVICDYVKDLKPELMKACPDRVFITHSGCQEAIIEEVKKQLEELGHFHEILVTRAGSVISSHCGPGTLGVLFVSGI